MIVRVVGVVRVSSNEYRLAESKPFQFGRADGPGQIGADDRRVSQVHGSVVDLGSGWALLCSARLSGLTVYDCDSPSRLLLPPQSGPVLIPFAHAVVAVEFKSIRHHLEVDSIGAPGWTDGWRSSAVEVSDEPADATIHPHFDIRFFDRTGRPLRWYQTLVALCEPRLSNPPDERIPTNREIAARLGVTQSMVENHYLDRLRRELGFSKFDEQSRLAAVVIALSQAIVTRQSISVLTMQGDADGQ